MSRIGVVGSINTDFVVRTARFPQPGETVIGESFAVYGGGKGANQAIAAARLGATVEFFGAVGQDSNSAERLAALRADEVGTEHISSVDGFGGVAVIQVESTTGQNSITLVPGANAGVEAGRVIPELERWCRAGDVVCQQLEVPLETVWAVLKAGNRLGGVNVLNAAPFDTRVSSMLELVDHLIVNEIEAGQLLGAGSLRIEDAARAASALLGRGVRQSVVITLGSHGAWLDDGETSGHVPARKVDVIDTTGAGDAFCGAFCAWLARGASLAEAVQAANVAGSIAVQRHGAQPSLPMLSEVQEIMGST